MTWAWRLLTSFSDASWVFVALLLLLLLFLLDPLLDHRAEHIPRLGTGQRVRLAFDGPWSAH